MKSIATLALRARGTCINASYTCLAALLFASACGGSGASSSGAPAPQPIAGDVERAQFDPALGVNLAAMTRRADGMYVQDKLIGTGGVALTGRSVLIRYTGWLSTGKQFDSGEITVTLGTNKTIRAWEVGLLGMRVGGKRRLVVPPALAYGDKASGAIPPNSVLVFDMEMMSVY
jgi:peptidylprolyl isomerase